MRIGFGFDVHRLAEGPALWLGGVQVSYCKGLIGHSDADVLIHAICDALLGAADLGDIGKLFPDTDNAYKNIDSKILLKNVTNRLRSENYSIVNIDTTLCLEKPKIAPYVSEIKETLAGVMGIGVGQVSVKATTTEKLGFTGREEGIAAYAVCLLELHVV